MKTCEILYQKNFENLWNRLSNPYIWTFSNNFFGIFCQTLRLFNFICLQFVGTQINTNQMIISVLKYHLFCFKYAKKSTVWINE